MGEGLKWGKKEKKPKLMAYRAYLLAELAFHQQRLSCHTKSLLEIAAGATQWPCAWQQLKAAPPKPGKPAGEGGIGADRMVSNGVLRKVDLVQERVRFHEVVSAKTFTNHFTGKI